MLQTVQVAIADGRYATAVREALTHSCAWRVEAVDCPDASRHDVIVLDEAAFARLLLPLSNPERVVLISRKEAQDPQILAQAWDAGILSVVSEEDPISTVLLAIMAAALRVEKPSSSSRSSEITPNHNSKAAPISPLKRVPR